MVAAFPLELDKRAAKNKCADNGLPPCACNNGLGLRRSSLTCPAKAFGFKDKASVSDGTLKEFSSKAGFDTQCDHIVELQYIASKMDKEICDVFLANNAKFKQFFNFINDTPRLVNVEGAVNNAKGVLFSTTASGRPKKFKKTTKKAALCFRNGLASYLQLVKNDAKDIANDIDAEMNRLVSGTSSSGFSNFESDYTAKLSSIITDAKQQALTLSNAPVTFAPPSSSSATTSAPSVPTSSSVPSSKKRPAPGSPPAPPPPAKKPKTNAPAPPPPAKKPKVAPPKPPAPKKKPATKTTTKKAVPKKKT
ncbi:hypothetical protein Moror_5833 [Moniliophthora roreri MCA 2997]|uniref:Uncharacterized protein n=1 Tax=Moniliophthora roreri (strain MCA 2997) TaxID=1381753 RepID=V2WK64_MONRO|nr:hypothetical protein Moror_5833 [Moniliophthora roreri MCA 2997]